MQTKFLKKEGFDYKFLVQGSRNDILSAIRRTIMLHVPVYAVSDVSIYKNESVMPDEMLAHRIGLVPIYSDDIDDNEHHLYLKKTSGTVYSGDISGNLEIPLKHIPLVKLTEGKNLELELLVKKGTGELHTKYSPASVFFYNLASIKQNSNLENIDGVCPADLLEKKANKIFLKDPYACDVCRYCESKSNKALKIEFKEDEFILGISPFGNLDLDVIIKESCDFLVEDLNELKSQLSGKSIDTEEKKTTKKSKSKTSKSLDSEDSKD